MKIVLTENPIERIFSQCAVCFLPEDVRPLRGTIGMVDWALNGLITHLIWEGRLKGSFLESTLIRPGRYLSCEKLLLVGMGRYHECGEGRIRQLGETLMRTLSGLKVMDISLSFPIPDATQSPVVFAENLTKGLLLEGEKEEIRHCTEQMNVAISCVFEQIDEALLGIQKAKVELKKHFNVIVLE